ncbi:hypothetical protein ACMFMG_007195 [Clarireedia jacksonii]
MPKLSSLAMVAILSFVEAKICTTITIPVTLNARNGIFDLPPLKDEIAVTKFAQDFIRRGQNYTAAVLEGYTTITDEYNISATACQPDHPTQNYNAWQFLTHGIGFDRGYWEVPFDNSYSYVDVAVDQYGYSTLAIDRLGIGESSQADPTNVLQAPAELSAIYEVTKMLRAASLPDLDISEPSYIFHVGHSFGSILSYELAAAHPEATDGLILQGFSLDSSSLPQTIAGFDIQAASTQHMKCCNTQYPEGYLTWANIGANQFAFLAPPYYNPLIGEYTERNKQPFTTGEILTLGSQPSSAPDFTGPVLVLTGNEDEIFCGGDCSATDGQGASIPAGAAAAFPKASKFEAYIQPNCGHAVNVHYNATEAYNVMNSFLNAQGF